MEARENMSAGVTVIGAEAPSNYHVAARTENPIQMAGNPTVVEPPMAAGVAETMGKKKRGRPRKYGPDGALSRALSPIPISSSAPPASTGNFSANKRGRGRPIGSENKQKEKMDLDNSGDLVDCSAGTNFMTHMITVNKGEDITMKIISFTKQGPRAICIISAIGLISNATLRHPDSSGATLTYEGIFEIITLSGSFTPTEVGANRVGRMGGLNVCLCSPDGRVIGGTLAGLLVAGGPVQVVAASFLPSGYQEQKKPKKQKTNPNPTPNAPTSAAVFPPNADNERYSTPEQNNSAAPKPNLSSSSIHTTNWASIEATPDFRKSATDINISWQGE